MIIINKKELINKINILNQIIDSSQSNVNLKTDSEKLYISTMCNERNALFSIDYKTSNSKKYTFDATINCINFLAILNSLPQNENDVILDYEDDKIKISNNSSNVKIQCVENQLSIRKDIFDFTSFDTSIAIKDIDISKIQKTLSSASLENNRYIYCGVSFKALDNESIEIMATDGRRLTRDLIKTKVNTLVENIGNYISIDNESIKTLISIFKLDNNITIFFNLNKDTMDRRVLFQSDSISYTASLLEGNIPSYEKVCQDYLDFKNLPFVKNSIKNEKSETFSMNKINKSKLTDVIRLASTVAEYPSFQVSLRISDVYEIQATCIDKATSFSTIESELKIEMPNDSLTILFNAKYFTEAIKNIECEYVKIILKSENKPIMILDDANPEYICLIMPMSC